MLFDSSDHPIPQSRLPCGVEFLRQNPVKHLDQGSETRLGISERLRKLDELVKRVCRGSRLPDAGDLLLALARRLNLREQLRVLGRLANLPVLLPVVGMCLSPFLYGVRLALVGQGVLALVQHCLSQPLYDGASPLLPEARQHPLVPSLPFLPRQVALPLVRGLHVVPCHARLPSTRKRRRVRPDIPNVIT